MPTDPDHSDGADPDPDPVDGVQHPGDEEARAGVYPPPETAADEMD